MYYPHQCACMSVSCERVCRCYLTCHNNVVAVLQYMTVHTFDQTQFSVSVCTLSHLLVSFLWDFISLSFSLAFLFCQWPYCYIEPLQMALAQIASASSHPSHSAALWSCTAGARTHMPGSSSHNSIHSASLCYCHMAGSWVAFVWSLERESEPRPKVINGFPLLMAWPPGVSLARDSTS